MPLTLENKIAAGFAAAAGFMLLVGGAAWWSAARSAETFRWVDHTHEVLYGLEAMQTKLLVLQSDSRGYALSANENLIRTYDADEAAAQAALRRLRQLITDNPGQLQRLERLEPLATRAIGLFRERIALRRSGGLEAVTKTRPNNTNRPIMDQVLDCLADGYAAAGGWPFLFLDLLQVAMDRGFGAAAQLFAHRIDGRIAPCGQQFIAGTQHFRLVDSGSGHGSPRYFVL